MALKVAINGMGVLGRELFRLLAIKRYSNDIEVMAMNDPNITPSNLAYLLKYDSVYHDYETADITGEDGTEKIMLNGKAVDLYAERALGKLPLGASNIDLVLDCTGQSTIGDLQDIISAGAKRAIALYPIDSSLPIIAYGVNHADTKSTDALISMPTIEDQIAGLVLQEINDMVGVEASMVKLFASYTNAQNTIDSMSSPNYEQGRAGAWNIIPHSSIVNNSVEQIVPILRGRTNSMTYRAPVIVGGAMDLTVITSKAFDEADVEKIFLSSPSETVGELLDSTRDPLVSSDVIGLEKFQLLLSATRTFGLSSGGSLTSITVLYDNIRGQALQAVRLLQYMTNKGLF